MENHQIFFLSSPPQTLLSEADRDMSDSLGLFADFHVKTSTRDDQDQEKQVLGFEGSSVEASYNKFRNEITDKAKSEAKKCEKSTRHKFAFQTRSQVDVLDDGYRWRKYGQKVAKNSKFPRSYYKCTFQGCNVKKQIQRLCGDEGIVVTTYEGMHTHSIEKYAEKFNQILTQFQTSYGTTTTTF